MDHAKAAFFIAGLAVLVLVGALLFGGAVGIVAVAAALGLVLALAWAAVACVTAWLWRLGVGRLFKCN